MADQRAIWQDAWTGRRQPVNGFARRCLRHVAAETAAPLTILEVGCGSGADTLFFARRGHCVTAIDSSRSAVSSWGLTNRSRDRGPSSAGGVGAAGASRPLPLRSVAAARPRRGQDLGPLGTRRIKSGIAPSAVRAAAGNTGASVPFYLRRAIKGPRLWWSLTA